MRSKGNPGVGIGVVMQNFFETEDPVLYHLEKFRAVNSAVECHPHTMEVAGSNPAQPTIC